MLLDAAADLVRTGRLQVDLYGDGPETPTLQAQIERLGIAAGVTLHGFVSHSELHGKLAQADVFAFPSIREFGGAVVLEAMALGIVPIVVDYGGPGELVTEETGYRIPIVPREAIVSAFRDQLTALCDGPTVLPSRSAAAQTHVQERFTWEAKAQQVMKVYQRLIPTKRAGVQQAQSDQNVSEGEVTQMAKP